MMITMSENQSKDQQPTDQSCSINRLEDSALFICHELRTPLTSIQGALGLLKTEALGCLSEQGQQVLAIAMKNANRLTRLADAIENQPVPPITVFSEETIEQLQLENQLYEALDRQEFYLVYQPIVAIETGQIIGFEALARWQHPTKGVISPATFIPLAEKTGCIHQLGLWVLEQACRQLYSWQQIFPSNPPLTISVNLSALQLLEPNLTSMIQRIIHTSGIAPQQLKLEVTESALIDNHCGITDFSALRTMGIQLCVDDFGTGYSSLGRLRELPIDVLKIDRSFVHNKQWDISETIVLLATKLGLDVIAEGVETADELAALRALGCNTMQGYYFSQPLDSQAATKLIMLS